MKLAVSTDLMRRSDAATIASGTPSRVLMQRAGEAVSRCYPWKNGVMIVCGTGNNGGDGYVLAAELHQRGISCRLVLLRSAFSEDGSNFYKRCVDMGIPWEVYSPKTSFSDASAIVDCLFGTGFRGDAEGDAAELICAINQAKKTVISVDINSGLCGDSGQGEPCIRSDLTVAIGSYKYGHFLGRAKDVIKELTCVDIGIPILDEPVCRLTEHGDFSDVLAERQQQSHKGDYGYVGILGGCMEYSGAVKLADMSCAALRAGCGVSTLAVPKSLAASVVPYLLESTLALIPDDGEGHMVFDASALDRFLQGKRAVAVGMGWGRSPDNEKILSYLLEHFSGSLVIDADGLNTLAEMDASILKRTSAKVILTPHPKEFERLSGVPVKDVLTDPVGYARRYATENGVCVLLKGTCTVVTDGMESDLVNRGCAGMATAGSGDVLSGVLVGLLGYAPATPHTVACAAHLNGLAGELAAYACNPTSMIASDTVRHLPEAISEMIS